MSKQYKEGIEIDPVAKEQLLLYPIEQLKPVKKRFQKLSIGIPKENTQLEKRVALRPEAIALLTNNGHEVIIESKAGINSSFPDHLFSEAGAKISYSAKEVLESDIVLKIQPPTEEELSYLKPGRTLISTIPMARLNQDYLRSVLRKKIICVAFELIQDRGGSMPAVRTMSEIAGSTVMNIAAEYLSSHGGGSGIIVGGVTGVPPTKVVIIGAGTVGEYAARNALGSGAEVKVFDKHIYKLRRLKYAVGPHIFTSTIDSSTLNQSIQEADVLITAVRSVQGRSPVIVSEEMVKNMKPGSIIIDVSIDHGGCVETSEVTSIQNPTFVKHGVIHYCVPNIASRVAKTSSTALSNIFAPYLLEIGECGGIDDMIFRNQWFMKGVYSYKGSLTNADIAKKFNLPHKDLGLLMAARI
ncbi:MAG: alanine dehydrogenase [Bacteroidota bacterium]